MSLILDLSKSDMEDLQQKLTLNLEKHSIADLPSMAAKVLIDRSGSMSSHFATGWVSNLISMFVLAAQHFDDDGELEVGSFSTDAQKHDDINLNSFGGDITRMLSIYADGGTLYTPAIRVMLDEEVKSESKLSGWQRVMKTLGVDRQPRVAVGGQRIQHISFVTDGDAADRDEFFRFLRGLMDSKVYVQIITLGSGVPTSFMSKLEELPHVGWHHIPNPSTMTTDDFFSAIANEKLSTWLEGVTA